MKFNAVSIIGWIAAILVGALNIFAGIMKFVPVDPSSPEAAVMQSMGMTPNLIHVLGVIELTSVVLFLIPRTSTIGFVLLVGYMSGALATVLTHAQDPTMLYVALALLTVSAYARSPELLKRARGQM